MRISLAIALASSFTLSCSPVSPLSLHGSGGGAAPTSDGLDGAANLNATKARHDLLAVGIESSGRYALRQASSLGLPDLQAITIIGPNQYKDGYMWVIEKGKKRPMNRSAASHHGYFNTSDCSPNVAAFRALFEEQLNTIPDGAPMGPDGVVNPHCGHAVDQKLIDSLQDMQALTVIGPNQYKDGYMWAMEKGKKRSMNRSVASHHGYFATSTCLPNQAAFKALFEEQLKTIPDGAPMGPMGVVNPHCKGGDDGVPLPDPGPVPHPELNGKVIKATGDGTQYFVENGLRRRFPSEEVLNQYGLPRFEEISPELMVKIATGADMPPKTQAVPVTPIFPVSSAEEKKIIDGGYMNTSFTLNESGTITISSRIWTNNRTRGFHGAATILFFDEDGTLVTATQPKSWGVCGTWEPGCKSDRSDTWNESISTGDANRIRKFKIVQEHKPKIPLFDKVQQFITWLNSDEGKNFTNIAREVAAAVATQGGSLAVPK